MIVDRNARIAEIGMWPFNAPFLFSSIRVGEIFLWIFRCVAPMCLQHFSNNWFVPTVHVSNGIWACFRISAVTIESFPPPIGTRVFWFWISGF